MDMKYFGFGEMLPISAIIPVRNGMQFLANFLESNVEQFSKLDEVIIINDNSSDGTLEYLIEKCSSKENFVILDNPSTGLVSALNLGINRSRNAWLARFDVDDTYKVFRIESQLALIEDGVGAIFSDYEIIDSENNSLGIITSPITPSLSEISLVNSRRTPHPSAILNKLAVQQVGGYQESEHPAEDLGLWLRLTGEGFKILTVPKVLLNYRMHEASVTSNKQEEMRRVLTNLIHKHDFSHAFNATIHSFDKEISKIRNELLSGQRIFLTGIDLLKVRKVMRSQGLKNIPKLSIRSSGVFFTPSVLISGILFLFQARRRRKYRRF